MRDVKLVRKNMREKRTEAARNRRTGEMTERLTVSGATTQRDIDKLLELSNENQFGRNEAYYKLQRYEDLEEQDRLIELPCKIGDTVYYINTKNRLSLFKSTVYEGEVVRFVTTRYGTSIVIQIRNEYGCTELYSEDNYNKTVFLTKEKAEAALKGENE